VTMLRTCSLFLMLAPAAAAQQTTFRVTVPASTPAADTIYIAGSFQGWAPGSASHALSELPDGRWILALDLPVGQPIEFKFTRGSWATVEKGPNGEELANRTHTPLGGELLDFTVATWADGGGGNGTISGHVESFTHAPFLGGRRVWVYLPPDYSESRASRYPVLYMHDGQNLFDDLTSFAGEWEVDETCEALIASGEIEPIIVVGVENGGAQRCVEYTPWPDPGTVLFCSGGGGGGEAYLQAIQTVLMPEIDARYRTRTGPENTFMSGSSLGGLISAYAGYAHADVWGRVAAVSPSYPWANDAMLTFAQASGIPTLAKFYQDMGTLESAHDELLAMEVIALAQGFTAGENFLSVEGVGHTHNEFYWAQRFPDILRFLIEDGCAIRSESYCVAAPNSVSPSGAVISADGSCAVESDNFGLLAGPIPAGEYGVFFHGASQVQFPFGDGFQCAAGGIVRIWPPLAANDVGFVAKDVKNSGPGGNGIMAGTTRNFQLWYRDPAGGANGFNLSNGLEVLFY